jgi:hypothetical protein
MSEKIESYRAAFFKSKYHAYLGVATLGLGFVMGHLFPLILGVVGYAIGWLYLPDMPFFKDSIDEKNNGALNEERERERSVFISRRDKLLSNLYPELEKKYRELVGYCEDIERETHSTHVMSGAIAPDVRTRKLDELMWTYLRLLSMDQSLTLFLNSEKQENIEDQIARVKTEIDKLARSKEAESTPAQERLFQSRSSMMETLERRLSRVKESRSNIDLVRAEQDRLVEQIKLLRADSFAMQNSELLSQRIDASMEQLAETNKWLAEMDSFKDVMDTSMPSFEGRIGYGVEQNSGSYSQIVEQTTPKRVIRKVRA